MEAFPFTDAEWTCVREVCRSLLNATLRDQAVLHASLFEALRGVLAELTEKYGEHPVLLETEADFTDEPTRRVELYERAIRHALCENLLTFSIRISLAGVLLEELNDPRRALSELIACRAEILENGDERERRQWQELHEECSRRTMEEAPDTST